MSSILDVNSVARLIANLISKLRFFRNISRKSKLGYFRDKKDMLVGIFDRVQNRVLKIIDQSVRKISNINLYNTTAIIELQLFNY